MYAGILEFSNCVMNWSATQFRDSYIVSTPFHRPVIQTVPQTLPHPLTASMATVYYIHRV